MQLRHSGVGRCGLTEIVPSRGLGVVREAEVITLGDLDAGGLELPAQALELTGILAPESDRGIVQRPSHLACTRGRARGGIALKGEAGVLEW